MAQSSAPMREQALGGAQNLSDHGDNAEIPRTIRRLTECGKKETLLTEQRMKYIRQNVEALDTHWLACQRHNIKRGPLYGFSLFAYSSS
jgi:hypothetical protein